MKLAIWLSASLTNGTPPLGVSVPARFCSDGPICWSSAAASAGVRFFSLSSAVELRLTLGAVLSNRSASVTVTVPPPVNDPSFASTGSVALRSLPLCKRVTDTIDPSVVLSSSSRVILPSASWSARVAATPPDRLRLPLTTRAPLLPLASAPIAPMLMPKLAGLRLTVAVAIRPLAGAIRMKNASDALSPASGQTRTTGCRRGSSPGPR